MAFRDLIRNYYFGKPGKRDFTNADLPDNRIQLFFQVFGVRWGSLVGLNLLYLLCWLPAIAWTALNLLQLNQLLVTGAPAESFRQVLFTWLLLLFPCVAITGPFNAGASLVTHRWAQDEHSFTFGDFKEGMQRNWKQALVFSVLDGLVPLLFYLCVNFYMSMAARSALFLLPMAISCLAAGVWCLAAPLVPQLIVSYKQRMGGILRNAVLLALAQLPRTVAIRLLTLAFPLLAVLSLFLFPGALQWIAMIASMLYALILLAFNKLVWASYSNFLGEKYLNVKIPGARTNIGLRPKEDE